MLLAAVGFFGGARRGLRFFFLGLGSLALLYALGTHTPVWRVFYEVVPGITYFRVPSMTMFIFGFSVATLAAFGVDRMLAVEGDEKGEQQIQLALLGGAGVMLLLVLLAASGVLASLWTSVVYSAISDGQLRMFESLSPHILRGASVGLLLTGACAGLFWALKSARLAPAGLLAGLTIVVVVDQLRVDTAFVNTLDFEQWSAPDPNAQAILDREQGSDQPYRVLDMRRRGQETKLAVHGMELAAGHHPNDLSRYRELIGMVGSSEPMNLYNNGNVRRLLNVRYLLYPDYALGAYEGPGILQRLQLQDGSPYETVIVDAGLPRARLVGGATVKSDEESVPYMLSGAFDPVREVVLPEAPPVALSGDSIQGTVSWVERQPDRMVLNVESSQPALLVVADNWYPDWHATVNGEATPVLRAYHTLRAVAVPAGTSEVEMWYTSGIVRSSAWISLTLLLMLIGANGFVWWRSRPAPGNDES